MLEGNILYSKERILKFSILYFLSECKRFCPAPTLESCEPNIYRESPTYNIEGIRMHKNTFLEMRKKLLLLFLNPF